MKRNLDTSVQDDSKSDRSTKIQRRQDPVSCNFCRTKKLKCDRVNPCSNCFARKVPCVYVASINGLAKSAPRQREGSSETCLSAEALEVPPSSTSYPQVSDFEARLRRLEHLAFSTPNRLNQSNTSTFENPRQQVLGPKDHPNPPPNSAQQSLISSSDPRKIDQDVVDTANRLECAALDEHSLLQSNYDAYNPRTSLAEHFASSVIATAHKSYFPPLGSQLTYSQILQILPPFELGMSLLDYYVEQVGWVYHILHIPTTRAQMKDGYARLYAGQTFELGKIALFATIFGTSAYFWSPSSSSLSSSVSSSDSIIPKCLQDFSRSDALNWSRRWSQLAHNCLSQVQYVANPTLEAIQAVMLLSHFLLPNGGASSTYTVLLSTMVNSAHNLNIHQIDSKRSIKEREDKVRRGEKIDLVELELKRRLWWDLASTDWFLTFMSGPQSGTYVVHPNQFHVSYPLNTDDALLTSDSAPESLDLSQPTEMTHFFFRCKMSRIFREIVDYATSTDMEVEDIPYEQILFFDKKCQDLLAEAPFWLQLDPKSRAKSKQINAERPYTAMQRLVIHFAVHSRIGRLHRAYLIRGSRDPKYAYSRMMCLRSARTVIEVERQIQQEFGKRSLWTKLMWFIIHHVFVATVILGMDYCFNQDNLGNDVRRQEIMDCCQVLEKSKEESEIARKGVEQLKRVLLEWRGKVDGELRPGTRSRVSPSPETNATDSNYLNEEVNSIPNSSSKNPPMPNSTTTLPEKVQTGMETNEILNMSTSAGRTGFEGNETVGFGVDDIEFDWLNSFNFDPEASAGVDWEALFKDLETRPGLFEDSL